MYACKMRKTSNSRNLFFFTTATAETQISTQFIQMKHNDCELNTLQQLYLRGCLHTEPGLLARTRQYFAFSPFSTPASHMTYKKIMEGKLAVAFLSVFVEFLPFYRTFNLLLKKYDNKK